MSKDRIQYLELPFLSVQRLVAGLIDVIVGIIIALICDIGARLEYEIIWKNIFPFLEDLLPILVFLWFIIFFPLYYCLSSSLTDGQTLGKMLLKIRVVTSDNKSTKKQFRLHLKRTFFMKAGTKVVKEFDPGVKGL